MISFDSMGTGRRVALLHGFTQTRRCWAGLDVDLARDHEVIRVDLPGHGDAAAVAAPMDEVAQVLADRIGPASWVGYSMGGRQVLHVAVLRPDVVEGVMVIGATAGIDDDDERAARVEADTARAVEIIVDGVVDFVDRWVELPLFAGVPPEHRYLSERRRNRAEGLASSLVLAGTGALAPLWSRLPEATAPLIAMAGELDERFVTTARRLVATWGGPAELDVVAGRTHAVHLEDPAAAASAVRRLTGADGADWADGAVQG